MNRREFIQTAAMAAAGTALATSAFSMANPKYRIGLQLYTVRDVIGKDPKGVLKSLADLGYQDIEAFGYNDSKLFGMPSSEFAAYVKSLGMRLTSGHYQLGKSERTKAMKGSVLNDWELACKDARAAGQEFMVVAYLNADERVTLDDYKFVCDNLNKAGEMCNKYGLRLNYHNHDFEFVKMDGQIPFDMMLEKLDPKLVGIELDLYWTTFAGMKPTDYFMKHPGRFEQWHIKDMDKADPKKNSIAGNGSIDFKSLLAHAQHAGLKNWYMEHDTYPAGMSSMESVKADVVYLKTL